MKITAETLSPAHLRHLRDVQLERGRASCGSSYWRIVEDCVAALLGCRPALDRCVTHWHEMFCEDIDALDVREKAALICQAAASNDMPTERQAAWALDLSDEDDALHLATLAIWEADGIDDEWPETFARAEALIRDGWEPS